MNKSELIAAMAAKTGETKKDADFIKACELTEKFAKKEGRQPRIMIA